MNYINNQKMSSSHHKKNIITYYQKNGYKNWKNRFVNNNSIDNLKCSI